MPVGQRTGTPDNMNMGRGWGTVLDGWFLSYLVLESIA